MLLIRTKYLLTSALFVFWTGISIAQPKDNSPFSQFGLGDFIDSDMPSSHGMGGLGSVYHDFFEANLENPASLGFLQYTSLQFGSYIKRSTYKRFDEKQTIWNGNLDHLSLNIPLINPLNKALERRETDFSWGTSISLLPYSQVGYYIKIIDDIDSVGAVSRNSKGYGGLYEFNIGNGVKFKNLAAGINLTYLYGKQYYDETTQFLDLENPYADLFQSSISYKSFKYRAGFIYEQPLDLKKARAADEKPSKLLSAGLYFSGESNLNTKSDISQLAYNSTIGDLDTVYVVTEEPATGTLPGSWGFGILYHDASKFRAGIDYQASPSSNYINDARRPEFSVTKDAWKLGLGASWIPDANSITYYFKRVEYRAGFYTKADPRVIDGEQVKESAFTLGASLPLILQRNIAFVQLGLDIGKRTAGDQLTDNFVRFKFGLVLNDNAWFIRGKYD